MIFFAMVVYTTSVNVNIGSDDAFITVASTVIATQVIEQDRVLTKQHIPYLLLGLISVNDAEIKLIVKDIIKEIIEDDGATSDEVSALAKIEGRTILTFAKVVTTDKTDCNCYFFPGIIRFLVGWDFSAKGIIISYNPIDGDEQYGWHLRINGEDVHKASGFIIGYFGDWSAWFYSEPPYFTPGMELDGTALLVIHGS